MKNNRFQVLSHIISLHKYQLLLTYLLFTCESGGLLLRPFFLGNAVDDLIKGSHKGLIYLAITHIVWLIAGTIRHRYDTRTYTAIYTSLVQQLLSKKYSDNQVSRLSAHSTLAREFIDFLEFDLNYVVEAIYNLLGSIIMLFYYNRQVVLVCLIILIPVMIVSYFYGKKMETLTLQKNDELEKQVDIITTQDKAAIATHYQNLRKWQIKISDSEAWNFGFMEIMVLIAIIISLIISIKTSNQQPLLAGSIIGIYNYVLKFASGLDTIPYTLQRLTTLKDINERIAHGSEELE